MIFLTQALRKGRRVANFNHITSMFILTFFLFGIIWVYLGIHGLFFPHRLNTNTMNLNWHWTALTVYLAICIFDFMIVPMWFGFMRPDYHTFLEEVRMIDDTMIQLELMKKLTQHHSPYTLQMGGLFHLAFGALLTGSAFGLNK